MCACQNWRIRKLEAYSHLDNSTNFTQSPWLHLPPAHQPKLQPQSATVSELSINRFHQGWIFKLMSIRKCSKSQGWKCGNSAHWGLLFGRFTNVHNLETANGRGQKLGSMWVNTSHVIFGAIEIRIISNGKFTVWKSSKSSDGMVSLPFD